MALLLSVLLRHAYGSPRLQGRPSEFHHGPGAQAIPRLGGICIVGGFVAAASLALLWVPLAPADAPRIWTLLACALAMFAVGLFDDLRALGARRKLLLQVLLAVTAWLAGFRIEQIKLPILGDFLHLHAFALPVTVLWLVAMTNLINLIDGIDGLAGGIGVLLMGLLAWVGLGTANGLYSLLCVGVLGGLLGFLRFNLPPARIYMGDGGAYFLGFFIGLVSIQTSNKGSVVAALAAPVLALALPILDTSLALVRRASKGLPLFRPDREHIHHRLLSRLGNKQRVLLVLYALCAVATAFAVTLYLHDGRYMAVLTGAGGVFVVWALQQLQVVPRLRSAWPILLAHWRLRRHSQQLLKLADWLEAEAAQCPSQEALWARYEQLATQLGLCQLEAQLDGRQHRWEAPGQKPGTPVRHWQHAWSSPRPMQLSLACPEDRLAEDEFAHVATLAGEAWHKAVQRWTLAQSATCAGPGEAAAPAPFAGQTFRRPIARLVPASAPSESEPRALHP
ncbi:MAG: hypothetical protein RJA22_1099 [Verrucomicrobiota bacterium]